MRLSPLPAAMQLTVVTATGRREALDLPPDPPLTAAALQAAVARRLGVPAAGLRLVRGGQALSSDEAVGKLKDGGEIDNGWGCREQKM